jgi:hypothetical protein
MDKQNQTPTADDVLDAYVDAVGEPNHADLVDWIRRFPQYEQEITDFTVSWSRIARLPPSDAAQVDEETLVLRGMSIVRNLVHTHQQQGAGAAQVEVSSISGLLSEGGRVGLKLRSLADAVDMSQALVREIDRRLILLASIPSEAIQSFARVLRCTPEVVTRYLDGPPRFATGVQHRADEAPALAEQRDFFAAVRDDTSLSDERRARWLALVPGDE